MVRLVALLALACLVIPSQAAEGAGRNRRRNYEPPQPSVLRDGRPNIRSGSAVIVDLDAGEELYAQDADQVRPIASVGKLMLALAVRGKGLPLDGKTTITEEDRKFASGGARSRLMVGKTFTNADLLRAMLVASDNRACSALGRGAGLTPDELIAAMNDKARSLGLRHTTFSDPSGLNGNVSTAREMVLILKAAIEDPLLVEILGTEVATIRSLDENPVEVTYRSTDLALRAGRHDVIGGKTGYTDEAKYCLAIAARFDGRKVAMVFLGAEGKHTRFGDFNRVAEWLQKGARPPTEATASVGALVEPPPDAIARRI
jgi:serine-type D-Ala-D-Ala endopeptidase (penicillin-binding protein 7)